MPENHRCVVGVRVGDEDTHMARQVTGGGAGLVGSEHARHSCCREQRPGELRVRPRFESADLDQPSPLRVSDGASRSG
jgi:hypothetical protein